MTDVREKVTRMNEGQGYSNFSLKTLKYQGISSHMQILQVGFFVLSFPVTATTTQQLISR